VARGGSGNGTPSPQPPPPGSSPGQAAGGRGSRKLSYKDQRDYDLLPARIQALDAAIAHGETVLADPDLFVRDPKRFEQAMRDLAAARAEKHTAEERWLALAELVEG